MKTRLFQVEFHGHSQLCAYIAASNIKVVVEKYYDTAVTINRIQELGFVEVDDDSPHWNDEDFFEDMMGFLGKLRDMPNSSPTVSGIAGVAKEFHEKWMTPEGKARNEQEKKMRGL